MYCIADFVLHLFVTVDDALAQNRNKDPRAHLWPSEIVTLGILYAIKGRSQTAFWRWAKANLTDFFPRLPDRTRLFRLLTKYQALADAFMATDAPLGFTDSFGIELIHPRREGRSKRQIGKKVKSNHRWIVGIKYAALVNARGRICDWDAEGANTYDGDFQRQWRYWEGICSPLYADSGFHRGTKRGGDLAFLVICKRGENNLRMLIESLFSVLVTVLHLKKVSNRTWPSLEARLTFVSAAYNLLLLWSEELSFQARRHVGIAEIACI
ncbi:MAG: hypothetical protein SFU56_00540 [Capsulimonadales bacterium]|nr:hypothetical protein [Capsulimonadales bacterium]